MQLWWNDNDGKESKYLGFILSRCQFIHDKPSPDLYITREQNKYLKHGRLKYEH